jgi:hypothetical protein
MNIRKIIREEIEDWNWVDSDIQDESYKYAEFEFIFKLLKYLEGKGYTVHDNAIPKTKLPKNFWYVYIGKPYTNIYQGSDTDELVYETQPKDIFVILQNVENRINNYDPHISKHSNTYQSLVSLRHDIRSFIHMVGPVGYSKNLNESEDWDWAEGEVSPEYVKQSIIKTVESSPYFIIEESNEEDTVFVESDYDFTGIETQMGMEGSGWETLNFRKDGYLDKLTIKRLEEIQIPKQIEKIRNYQRSERAADYVIERYQQLRDLLKPFYQDKLNESVEDWGWIEKSNENPLSFGAIAGKGEIWVNTEGLSYEQKTELFDILEDEVGKLLIHQGSMGDTREQRIDNCATRSIGILLHCGHEEYDYIPQENHVCCMGNTTYEEYLQEIEDYHSEGCYYVDGRDFFKNINESEDWFSTHEYEEPNIEDLLEIAFEGTEFRMSKLTEELIIIYYEPEGIYLGKITHFNPTLYDRTGRALETILYKIDRRMDLYAPYRNHQHQKRHLEKLHKLYDLLSKAK